MLIRDIRKEEYWNEGRMHSTLFDCDIDVRIDYGVSTEYAERCAAAFNSLSEELVTEICEAAVRYYLYFIGLDEEGVWRNEVEEAMTVRITEDTDPHEILKCICRESLSINITENDEKLIGYQIEGSCDWEEEHGIEFTILDGKLIYLGAFEDTSPWSGRCKDDEWNFAIKR